MGVWLPALGVPDPIGVRFADLEKSRMTCLRESAQENLVTPLQTSRSVNPLATIDDPPQIRLEFSLRRAEGILLVDGAEFVDFDRN